MCVCVCVFVCVCVCVCVPAFVGEVVRECALRLGAKRQQRDRRWRALGECV